MHLKDINITGEQTKNLIEEELSSLSLVAEKLQNGEKQVAEYGKQLEDKYGNLRLQKFVVVSLGFERVCFRKII